jgi:signal transduction histidine kinase/putative methionine-R-sulfoxide reductase with GAF domain
MKLPRWRLFPKYATLIIAVVAGVLVISGAINLVFSWREVQAHLVALQVEKAQNAAAQIAQFVLDIEHELGWTTFPRTDASVDATEERRIEYVKLQRQVPAITELVWIGPDGRERLRESRLAISVAGSGTDWSNEPAFTATRDGKTSWFGPVRFQKGTEPYMSIARPIAGGGVTVAEVNLKFVGDVVSRIKIGQKGLAYAVDSTGALISHPDISLVLAKTDLMTLPQRAALDRDDTTAWMAAQDFRGQEVFAAHARIPTLNWTVFVETPRVEAIAPLYDAIVRLVLLLVGGLLLAAAESFFLARALVRPIQALQDGAARIGAGELDQRIQIKTGDELEGLAEQFNQMGAELQASYAGLERKVEARTAEVTEALDYQTAISAVLRVISQSPTDVQPVFEAIMDSAKRLFGTSIAAVFRYESGLVHMVATRGWSSQALEDARRLYPGPPNPAMLSGRVILSGRVQTIVDAHVDPAYDQTTAHVGQWRRMIGAPMLKDGVPVGVVVVAWPDPGETPQRQADLLKTFADQAAIAIENVRLISETKEALEQQTATAEILQVISNSVADTQPVFEKIIDSCQHLFTADLLCLLLVDDADRLQLAAQRNLPPDLSAMFPRTLSDSTTELALRERRVLNYPDVRDADLPAGARAFAWRMGTRSMVVAPLLREDRNIGSIIVTRTRVTPFTDKEVVLLKTFADQAVIAIQNARLFNETKEALEQQTATSEVLGVISSSVADVQPVLDAVAERSRALCKAHGSRVWLLKGDQLRAMTGYSVSDSSNVGRGETLPLRPTSVVGRAFVERNSVHVHDVASLDPVQYPDAQLFQRRHGFHTALAVPMLRDGESIGVIAVLRNQVQPFSAAEIRLIETFADQAVIAIENARLFHETKEALEQQTATAEVLSVISNSVADTAPVFEKILHSCSHLFESSEQGVVLVGDDGRLHLGAHRGGARERLAAMFPRAVSDEPVARAMAEQRVLHYPDVLRDAEAGSLSRWVAERLGVGSYTQVFAPMRWEGEGAGYLYVVRGPVAPFSDKEIGLLKTFADQAAIAIQNAKLFHEIEDKSRQLEAANRHKSEFLANMSHELRTPLNAIIGFSEVLTEQMFGDVNDKQMEYLQDIHSSGQHLLELINDVLDLSKIEAGKMELDLSCFDLGLLLEHSTTLVRERAQRHGLSLELKVGEGLGEWVADARKVKQIVVNLLSNAVKFTPNGGRVSVSARHLNGLNGHAGDWAEVSVSDTGVGIAREDQALVFEEFRQASGDVLRKAEGTGLGLALVKRFVELHGGVVTLDSEPGRGSTFRFTLPQREVKVLQ